MTEEVAAEVPVLDEVPIVSCNSSGTSGLMFQYSTHFEQLLFIMFRDQFLIFASHYPFIEESYPFPLVWFFFLDKICLNILV